MSTDSVVRELESERERIWLKCPQEVKDLGNGIVPRGTGSRGQYLSTLIFAEGEARTLSDEMLWGLLQVAEKPGVHLPTLQAIVTQIIGYKADFFDFVGLPEAASFVHKYVAAAAETKSIEEFVKLTGAALSYGNRIHMWIDAVFPWGLGNGFKRADRKDVA
jgi:Cucumopine synthase C-terminal helical bundle domain